MEKTTRLANEGQSAIGNTILQTRAEAIIYLYAPWMDNIARDGDIDLLAAYHPDFSLTGCPAQWGKKRCGQHNSSALKRSVRS